MNKTQSETAKKSTATHRRMQHSSTLNRKYVKSPAARKASTSRNVVMASASEADARAERAIQKAAEQKRREEKAAAIQQQATAKLQQKSGKKSTTRSAKATPRLTAKQRKDQAIAQALKSVTVVEQDNAPAPAAKKSPKKTKKIRSKHTRAERSSGNGKRFLIAFTCAAACVAALGALINANMPDISVRVAAMQTGIEASYPSYIPRDYSLANINSEEGKITMDFSGPNGDSFTLVEEKSSWDSNALLNNYVKPTWQEAYTVTHEQGITIYIAGSDAAWVNGGILYTLDASSNNLTKKQIRTIVTSL